MSHHTRVENILTLLNAKYIGTPHLRFSMNPPPMTLLSVDPSDPNLWFSQLLSRRSSGIEGIQEFTTVVIVPRDQAFCINARLRRVCVLDVPPGPLEFTERFNLQQHLGRLLAYLDRAYPPGTPLDDFDVDLIDPLKKQRPGQPPPQEFTQPVLENFSVGGFVMVADVISPTPLPGPGFFVRASVNFKMHLELWLETLQDEYERAVARSPLERGILIGEDRTLDTCFAFSLANGGLAVTKSSATVAPFQRIEVDPHEFDLGGVTSAASSARKTARERAYEAVTRWNLLENRLAVLLGNRQRPPRQKGFTFGTDVVATLIEGWARLRADDPANEPLDQAAKTLGLDDRQRRLLEGAGVGDLRGIAEQLRSTPIVQRYNATALERQKLHKEEKRSGPPPEPVRWALTAEDAAAMRRKIGVSLERARVAAEAATSVAEGRAASTDAALTRPRSQGERCLHAEGSGVSRSVRSSDTPTKRRPRSGSRSSTSR